MTLVHHVIAGLGRLRRPAFDARAAVELAKLDVPFFPASRFALAPSALLTLVNEVVLNRRQLVLELGSGASTLYLAKALEMTGGTLVTVDSDRTWLDQVVAAAQECGPLTRLIPVFAPLLQSASMERAWYDPGPILSALRGRKIDLLLVDGPPAHEGAPSSREPAIPHLKDCLAPNCSIFLDDIHRPSHAKIAKDWGRLLGVKFLLVHARGGFAYASIGRCYDPLL